MKTLTATTYKAWTTIKSFMVLLCAVEYAVYAVVAAIFNMFYDKLTIFNLGRPPPRGRGGPKLKIVNFS
jgi:hypothetical protein